MPTFYVPPKGVPRRGWGLGACPRPLKWAIPPKGVERKLNVNKYFFCVSFLVVFLITIYIINLFPRESYIGGLAIYGNLYNRGGLGATPARLPTFPEGAVVPFGGWAILPLPPKGDSRRENVPFGGWEPRPLK